MYKRIGITITACLIAGLLAAGCGDNRADDQGMDRNGLQQQNQYGMQQQNRGDAWNRGARGGGPMNPMNQRNQMNAGDQDAEYQVAERAADEIVQLAFVQSAYVLKTENNAYVAAVLENGTELTRTMEHQIAQAVRRVDDTVDHVYVSTNPDFIDRVDTYIDDLRQGRPVEGFVEEFSEIIERLFPNAR